MEAAFDISVEASSILTIFDERDRPVKRVFYGPNDVIERRVLMRYDTGGRLVEKGECEAEGIIREDLRHLYRYDVEGRLVEKTMYYYGLWTYWKTFVYNDQGDVVEERHRRTGGVVEEGGDQGWKTLSRYQYDDSRQLGRAGSGDRTPNRRPDTEHDRAPPELHLDATRCKFLTRQVNGIHGNWTPLVRFGCALRQKPHIGSL